MASPDIAIGTRVRIKPGFSKYFADCEGTYVGRHSPYGAMAHVRLDESQSLKDSIDPGQYSRVTGDKGNFYFHDLEVVESPALGFTVNEVDYDSFMDILEEVGWEIDNNRIRPKKA